MAGFTERRKERIAEDLEKEGLDPQAVDSEALWDSSLSEKENMKNIKDYAGIHKEKMHESLEAYRAKEAQTQGTFAYSGKQEYSTTTPPQKVGVIEKLRRAIDPTREIRQSPEFQQAIEQERKIKKAELGKFAAQAEFEKAKQKYMTKQQPGVNPIERISRSRPMRTLQGIGDVKGQRQAPRVPNVMGGGGSYQPQASSSSGSMHQVQSSGGKIRYYLKPHTQRTKSGIVKTYPGRWVEKDAPAPKVVSIGSKKFIEMGRTGQPQAQPTQSNRINSVSDFIMGGGGSGMDSLFGRGGGPSPMDLVRGGGSGVSPMDLVRPRGGRQPSPEDLFR